MLSRISSPAGRAVSDGGQVADFIDLACKVSKGSHAGESLNLRRWQRQMLVALYRKRQGRRVYRQGLIGFPRKNGKSALGSGIALYGLTDEPGGEVYSCAGDKEQARIVFAEAKRTVDSSPVLAENFKCYRDAIEYPRLGSVYRVLSAEAYTKEGLNPSLVIFDEVHVQPNDDLWNVMNLGSGTREQPLVLGITTAGVKYAADGRESLCYRLWQKGMRISAGEPLDPSFFFWWYSAPDNADYTDPKVWADANPAMGDFLFEEDFASTLVKVPENEYRTKRLNQWVSAVHAWLPQGAWDRCADRERSIPDGSEIVLGFDGSFTNDSTALVAVEPGSPPFVSVVECWERPSESAVDWRVPIADVEDAIRAACRRWSVRAVVCDPYGYPQTYQTLDAEGIPILEFPQSASRMVPATNRFYEAVCNGGLAHSGDPRLARHVANCVTKTDQRGTRIAKESRGSGRKIDLAVASVMALEEASVVLEPVGAPQFLSMADIRRMADQGA